MKRNKLYCCFIDFEKAFDTINRGLLWYKLSKIGMPSDMINILKSIYVSTSCCVRVKQDYVSSKFETFQGLRQGCHLSSLLFSLFINDLSEWMHEIDTCSPCIRGKKVQLLLYADDVVLLSNTVGG